MASVEVSDVRKSFGSFEVIHGVSIRVEDGQFVDSCRAVGMRQVDASADGRRPRVDHQRRASHRRAGRQRLAAQGARHRDGVPELCALSANDGGEEHEFLARARQAAERGDRRQGQQGGRHPGLAAVARALPAPIVGRPAAAGGDGPGDRARSGSVPVRRAAVQSRRQAPGADAGRDQGAAAAAGVDDRSMSRTTRSRR